MKKLILIFVFLALMADVYASQLKIGNLLIINYGNMEKQELQTFIAANEFDQYVNEYNRLRITKTISRLNYHRIGFINTDNSQVYTFYLDNGKITKVVKGLDAPEFVASASIMKIHERVNNEDFEGILDEIKIPFKVKLRALSLLWVD